MAKQLIINADDFGMSEAFSLGVVKGFKEGVISSVSLMVNLPASQFAADLAKEIPSMYLGLHSNLVLGRPCSDPKEIPTLVDENGLFLGSKDYKNGKRLFNYQDAKTEILAQMDRFEELTGYKPTHIEGHSALDENIGQAFYDIAVEKSIHASMFAGADVPELKGYKKVRMDYTKMAVLDRGVSVEDFLRDYFDVLSSDDTQVTELHFHPGYIDQFILDHSTLTFPRCRDLATLLDSRVKEWIEANKIELIHFGNLKETG